MEGGGVPVKRKGKGRNGKGRVEMENVKMQNEGR